MAAVGTTRMISTITPPDVDFYSSEEVSPRRRPEQVDFATTWTDEKGVEADIKEEQLRADTAILEAETQGTEGPLMEKERRVEDLPEREPTPEEPGPRPPGWTRGDRMAAILLREETRELIEVLTREDLPDAAAGAIGDFLLRSKQNLHTFAALVSEDLLSVGTGQLSLTPLALRLVEQVVRLE
jgi:hypothetical protein